MGIIDTSITEVNTSDALRDNLISLLRKAVLVVDFTKKDGSGRKITCTLKEDLITTKPSATSRNLSNEIVRVWDLENDGWRSFRVDSINSINLA